MSKQNNAEQQTNNGVADAERVLAALETQRRALIERGQEIAETRKRISYAALADSDERAKKALTQLDGEATAHAHRMQSLLAAIAEAEQRVAAARQAEAVAEQRDQAKALRALLAEFTEIGTSLDEACAALAEEGDAMRDVVRRMRALGCEFPTDPMVRVNGLLALRTALGQTIWRHDFSPVPPKDRRTWASLVREWAARIESNYIAPHLGAAEQTATEAA